MKPPLALLAALALGCGNDQQFGKASDFGGAGDQEIEVTPTSIDFGTLSDGEVATGTFTVANVGSEESILEVSEITIGGEAGGFTILSEETSFDLPGGGAGQTIEVAFTPEGAWEQAAEAIVASNDEDEARVTVELLGEGLVPELQIDPDPLSMGTAYIGCSKDNELTLTNVGTDTLIISSISQSGEAFTLTDGNSLPLPLEPNESTTVQLLFTPTEERTYDSIVTVTSNEPIGTREATQDGDGRYAAEYQDTFEVPEDPPADIVFYVDQSCSMDDDQRNLASNFSSFISQLSTVTTDWHVMVANDDDGCNNSGILLPTSPDYEGRFESAVGSGGGNYTEAGLTVTSRAVDATDAGECNEGFMRPSAMLHIIMVSDEPEQSTSSWDSYVSRVVAKKGDAALVKFSAIAGDYPGGCSSSGNSAEPGTGYYEAVSYTGGEFLSICSNWASNVRTLADASVSQDTFALEHAPIPETIEVEVNGSARASGWTYDSTTNSVVFEESQAPAEGDTVDVYYAGQASCD